MRKRKWMKTAAATALTVAMTVSMCACGAKSTKKTALDPENPTTVTVWNYYNGDQLNAFNKLIEKFNAGEGAEKGITVVGVSQGDINTLADSLIDSVNGKAGAKEKPTLAAVYSETAYILNEKKALAPMDSYFSKADLDKFIPAFVDEGRFDKNSNLLLVPISKSTEVFTANETDWEGFAKKTGIKLSDVKTQEDLVKAAKAYYEYTDALTPKVKEDGKALYGRDSVANYIYIGCKQLGHEMFPIKDGKMTMELDKATFRTLWDNYYIPFINGYFGAYANFRSEDCKTGKILAMTSSSSSMSYVPTQVTLSDDSTHDITMTVEKSLPFKDAVENATVQQGASFCMLKSTKAEQEGAAEFLKWITKDAQNMDFSMASGYSPVTKTANTQESVSSKYTGDTKDQKGKNVLEALKISADAFSKDAPYATKPFNGSKDVRAAIETAISDACKKDRKAVEKAIKSGKTRKQAVASYETDAYFDKWFNALQKQIETLTSQK